MCNSYPVLCANCKENCVETVSCPGTSDIFNPCYTNCDDRIASGSVLNFQYELIPLYPAIRLPLQVSASAVTIDVSFNVSFPGTVYCAALSEGTQLASVVTVLSAGHSAVAHQPDDNITISITGVSPETNYDIYCYTQSLSGHAMPLSEVVASKRTIVTECCRAIVATVTHKSIVQYFPFSGVAESVFSFTLNSPPTGQLGVVLDVSSTRCSGSTTIADDSGSSVVPNTFSFLPTTRFLSGSFVVRGENSGCYVVTGRSIGQDLYKTLTVVTEIRNLRAPPPLPTLQTTRLSDDGRLIIITLNSDTDRGESVLDETYTSFACDAIFSFPGSAGAVCYWESDSEVIVEIGSGLELAKVGDTLILLDDTIRAACVERTVCSAYGYSPQSSLTIAGPANPLVPTVLLSVAELVGSCDLINLDATSSSGSGGRPWVSVVWSVTGTDSSYNNADIASFLNTNFANTDEVAILPNQYITAGQSYIFTLALENFLAQSAVVQQRVNVAGTDVVVPQVRIVGSSPESFRWKDVDLYALAVFPDCVVTENVLLSYSWNVYKERTYVPSLVSESLDPRHFKLSAYKLDAGTTYTFQVTVTVKSDISGLELRVIDGVASFQVQMGVSGVTARISGPSSIKTSASYEVTLDASSSRDLDFPQSESLVFAWTCLQLSPSYGESCDAAVSPDSAFLTIPVAALSVGTYNLSVIVTNPLGSFGSAFVKIEFTQRIIPIITLNTVQAKYNAQSKITLTGRIQTNSQLATAVWSSTTIPELASTTIPVTPLSKSLTAQTSTFQLGLGAHRLTPGLSYSFTLTSSYANIADGASVSVVVVMNSAPRGGVVVANPISGTALTTEYTLVTSQWTDDASDLPLTYIMSYFILSVNNLFMAKSSSGVASTRTILGQGLENMDYVVRLVATARDIFGGQANTSTSVEVLPIEPTPAVVASSVEALETALEDEDADATTQLIDASVNSINAVDCNVPTACSALNREVCSTTARTCGSCLSGYIGIDGHSNAACQLESMSVPIGGACTSDALCFTGSCMSGICIDVAKSCPNNCTGLGTCVHTDSDGDEIQFCSISNARCHVACSCPSGTYGSDCSLVEAEYTELLYFRERMCISLFRSMQFQDGSAEVVNARARSAHDLLIDVTQLSSVAVEFCTSVLVDTVAEYPSLSCQGTTPGLIVASLSQIVGVKSTALSAELFANVSIVVEQLSTSCKSQLVLGEDPIALTSENLNILNSLNEQDQLNPDFLFSLPQSEAAKFNAAPTASATIDASGATDDINAVVGVSVVQYNNNPRGLVSNATSLMVQLDGYSDAPIGVDGRRRRLAVGDGVDAEITLINTLPVDYGEFSPSQEMVACLGPLGSQYIKRGTCASGFEYEVTCPRNRKGYFTVQCPTLFFEPYCTTFDGKDLVRDPDCSVVSFDALSTTCRCVDDTPSSSLLQHRRSLQQIGDTTVGTVPLSVSVREYGMIVVPQASGFQAEFEALPVYSDARRSAAVVWSTVVLVVATLIVFLALRAWDRRSRNNMKIFIGDADAALGRGGRTVVQFFASVLPEVFQEHDAPWYTLLPARLLQYHTLVSMLYLPVESGRPARITRRPQLPLTRALGKLLTFIFMNTLLAYIVYPYDSECMDITSESECEDRKLTAYHNSCEWSERHESCRYRAPGTSAFNVIVFSSIVILASVIYNRVFDWVLSAAWSLQKYPLWSFIPTNVFNGHSYSAATTIERLKPLYIATYSATSQSRVAAAGGGGGGGGGAGIISSHVSSRQYIVHDLHHDDDDGNSSSILQQKAFEVFAPRDEFKRADSNALRMLRAARLSKTAASIHRASELEEATVLAENFLDVPSGLHRDRERQELDDLSSSRRRRRDKAEVAAAKMYDAFDIPFEQRQTKYERACVNAIAVPQRLMRRILASRSTALNIFNRLAHERFTHDREKLLMQCFIIDSMPTAIRPLVIQGFFPNGENFWSPYYRFLSRSNMELGISLAGALLCTLHFVGMVVWLILFDWVVVSSNVTLWSACLALSIGLYFIIIEPVVILLREVLVKQQLVGAEVADICEMLLRRTMVILRRRSGLIRNAHSPIQHLNPACRAARSYPFLPVSRLLISVNDSDIAKLPDRQQSSITSSWTKWAACMLHRAPLVLLGLAHMPYKVSELLCDLIVSASFAATLLTYASLGATYPLAAIALGAATALVLTLWTLASLRAVNRDKQAAAEKAQAATRSGIEASFYDFTSTKVDNDDDDDIGDGGDDDDDQRRRRQQQHGGGIREDGNELRSYGLVSRRDSLGGSSRGGTTTPGIAVSDMVFSDFLASFGDFGPFSAPRVSGPPIKAANTITDRSSLLLERRHRTVFGATKYNWWAQQQQQQQQQMSLLSSSSHFASVDEHNESIILNEAEDIEEAADSFPSPNVHRNINSPMGFGAPSQRNLWDSSRSGASIGKDVTSAEGDLNHLDGDELALAQYEAARSMPTLQTVRSVLTYDPEEDLSTRLRALITRGMTILRGGHTASQQDTASNTLPSPAYATTASASGGGVDARDDEARAVAAASAPSKIQLAIREFLRAAEEHSRQQQHQHQHIQVNLQSPLLKRIDEGRDGDLIDDDFADDTEANRTLYKKGANSPTRSTTGSPSIVGAKGGSAHLNSTPVSPSEPPDIDGWGHGFLSGRKLRQLYRGATVQSTSTDPSFGPGSKIAAEISATGTGSPSGSPSRGSPARSGSVFQLQQQQQQHQQEHQQAYQQAWSVSQLPDSLATALLLPADSAIPLPDILADLDADIAEILASASAADGHIHTQHHATSTTTGAAGSGGNRARGAPAPPPGSPYTTRGFGPAQPATHSLPHSPNSPYSHRAVGSGHRPPSVVGVSSVVTAAAVASAISPMRRQQLRPASNSRQRSNSRSRNRHLAAVAAAAVAAAKARSARLAAAQTNALLAGSASSTIVAGGAVTSGGGGDGAAASDIVGFGAGEDGSPNRLYKVRLQPLSARPGSLSPRKVGNSGQAGAGPEAGIGTSHSLGPNSGLGGPEVSPGGGMGTGPSLGPNSDLGGPEVSPGGGMGTGPSLGPNSGPGGPDVSPDVDSISSPNIGPGPGSAAPSGSPVGRPVSRPGGRRRANLRGPGVGPGSSPSGFPDVSGQNGGPAAALAAGPNGGPNGGPGRGSGPGAGPGGGVGTSPGAAPGRIRSALSAARRRPVPTPAAAEDVSSGPET